ncbi:LuxR C-terminal-related transcriptional regulator [Crossiella sp. CA198]|uniref:LuxR C-terminal-related transcriptional regulator n=1 Tax=Crossiella sp. CA198 TaxID=3455607 RepID=UPI003F8D2C12
MVLVDDEDVVRRGFGHVLGATADLAVVAECRADTAALRLLGRCRPEVVLVDAEPEFLHAVTEAAGGAGIIALGRSEEHLFRLFAAGARGFLRKSVGLAELVYAVRAVGDGQSFVSPSVTQLVLDHLDLPAHSQDYLALSTLSPRETEVLRALADGRSNREIGAELYLAAATVKTHVSRILGKLGLANRMQAALLAHRLGLVRPPW